MLAVNGGFNPFYSVLKAQSIAIRKANLITDEASYIAQSTTQSQTEDETARNKRMLVKTGTSSPARFHFFFLI